MRAILLVIHTAAVVFCISAAYSKETAGGTLAVSSDFQLFSALLCAAAFIPWVLFIRRS